MDGELQRTLSEFDGMLQREQAALEEGRDAGGGGTRAETQEQRRASGGAGGVEGMEGPEGGREQPTGQGAADTGGSPDQSGSAPDSGMGGAGDETEQVAQSDRVPPDVGDGRDDDIVARQLREAAMKEEDPELREKLWDEYRRYKRGEGQ
jgi:hypothetical protein